MAQHCSKTVLFFFLLVVSFFSRAQVSLFPFEDYQNCTTGFRDNWSTDTVYQAKFENTIEITYHFQTRWGFEPGLKFWILADNGKYGCLCSNGEWILDCSYDALGFDYFSNQFIAKLNGKVGTIKQKLETGFPYEYDEIFVDVPVYYDEGYSYGNSPSYDEFFVRKDKLLGVYTFEGNEIIRPAFDTIRAINWTSRLFDTTFENEFYIVTKNGLKGLFDDDGNKMIEPLYREVESFYESQKLQNTILFQVTDTLGQFSVFDEYGKQLTSFSPDKYSGVITEWTNQQFHTAGFATQRNQKTKMQRMTNLTTGKSSGWFLEMRLMGDWFLAQTKTEWMVLNSNFDTLVHQLDPNDLLFYFDYSSELKNARYIQNATEPYLPEVTFSDYESTNYSIQELFVVKRMSPLTRKERKEGVEPTSKKALVNVTSGVTSPFYDQVVRLGTNGVYYYWCFDQSENNHYQISIYDGKGKRLNSLNVESGMEELLSNRYLIKSIYDRQYPYLSYQKKNGKYAVYGIDGWQPDLPEFDNQVTEMYKWEDGTGHFRIEDSVYLFHFTDLNGKPLLGGKLFGYSSDYHYEYEGKKVTTLKNEEEIIFVNERLDVLFDSCQEINYVQYPSIPLLDPLYKKFAVRNGFVYAVFRDSFLLVDAKLFLKPNGMNKIGNGFYVDDSGRKFTADAVRIYLNSDHRRTGKLLFWVENNQMTLRKTKDSDDDEGTFLRVIPNIYDYEIDYNALKVITTDQKEGYIDKETGEWLLKPVYESTRCLDETHLFAQSNNSSDKHWFVVNKEGEPLTKPIFDDPVYFNYLEEEWTYAQSDGKIGLINKKYEWVTEPLYYDKELYSALFLLANDHYAIVDLHTGKSFRAEHDSVTIVSGKVVFWFNDSIQMLNSDGSEMFPPTSVSEVQRSKNLRELIYGEPYSDFDYSDSVFVDFGIIYYPEANHFLTQLSNECILENAKNDLKIFEDSEGHCIPNYSMHESCLRYPLFVSDQFYSEKVSGQCYDHPISYEDYHQDFSYRNYRIVNDTLVRAYCIGDILKEGIEYETQLNKLIETKIQENQLFGIACANMPAAIEELKRNFYLEESNLCFLYYDLGETEGSIRFELGEVKDLLKK